MPQPTAESTTWLNRRLSHQHARHMPGLIQHVSQVNYNPSDVSDAFRQVLFQ